ncbi:hypothetical protein [Salipaludibacillus keqinensis]|uniref:hypothetical protein n=1 Tax=Salipaludibacillus keqinensis TaxID=2045207 RepID=UPI0018EE58B1|nr:hypothetical protein [Salipaludibacillus keqinensis]
MEAESKEFGVKFILAVISYIIAAVFSGVGFHKLFVYENSDSFFGGSTNAYVGGDAYNYIINANLATAYFTLAILFTIIGTIFLIANYLAKSEKREELPGGSADTISEAAINDGRIIR